MGSIREKKPTPVEVYVKEEEGWSKFYEAEEIEEWMDQAQIIRARNQKDYETFQKRSKKERVLLELFVKDTSFPVELAKITGVPVDEVEQLLEELVTDKLIKHIQAKYYKLTYEGYSWAKSFTKMKKSR